MTPTPNNEALADRAFTEFAQREYRNDEDFTAHDLQVAYRAWKAALASSGQAASAVPEVAADKSAHDHMMTIACRVWEGGGHETTKVLLREVCKALAADKNLLRKLAPTQPAREGDALDYATRLAQAIHAKHFAEVPQWRPLPDLLGVLTQIDNMTSGLATPAAPSIETSDEAAFTAVLIQRDLYHDIADELAERIAKITGVEIGEHSSNNDPWMKAKYAADEYLAAPAGAGVEEFPLPDLATAVIDAARDALNDSIDALDTLNIPSHLAAALSLRLDEYDASLGLQARTEGKV